MEIREFGGHEAPLFCKAAGRKAWPAEVRTANGTAADAGADVCGAAPVMDLWMIS